MNSFRILRVLRDLLCKDCDLLNKRVGNDSFRPVLRILGSERSQEAARVVCQAGGEEERVRRTCACTITETDRPEFGHGKRLSRCNHQRTFKCSCPQIIGIDLGFAGAVWVIVGDKQVATKLAPTRWRDGQSPGGGEMDASLVGDHCLDKGAVRGEFIDDAASLRLVCVGDEDRLSAVDAELLNVERGIAMREFRKMRVGKRPCQLPLAIEDVDLAAVLVGRIDLGRRQPSCCR